MFSKGNVTNGRSSQQNKRIFTSYPSRRGLIFRIYIRSLNKMKISHLILKKRVKELKIKFSEKK